MDQLKLSNNDIQSFNDELAQFIETQNIQKHNKTWLTLFLEETLLKYQDEFGPEAQFSYNIKKRFSNLLVELSIEGESVNVLHPKDAGTDTILLDNLFNNSDGQVLYNYKGKRNIISVSMPIDAPKLKIPGSPQLHALILAVILGFSFKLLPSTFTDVMVNDYISPVYSVLMSALKGLMEPVIFISLVIGICTLDDFKTLSTIGKKTILSFIGISTIMYAFAVIACIFVFPSAGEGTRGFNPAEILTLLISSVPTNIIAPFADGNMIQIVVLGFVTGIAVLMLGEKSNGIKSLILEFKFFFFSILEMFIKILPFVVFLSMVKVILTLDVSDSATVWKIIVVDQLLVSFTAVFCLVRTSIKTKASIKVLFKKVLPIFNLSFVTGSSTAVIPEFYRRLPKYFGVDETYANYWVPLSNAFFSPSTIMALIVYAFFSAHMQGVGISIGWLIVLYIMIIQIGMATPRIPGGIIASCTILFSQLGITTDQIGIIMAANVLLLYLDTAVAAITRCCCAVDVACKQGYCDLEILRSDMESLQ